MHRSAAWAAAGIAATALFAATALAPRQGAASADPAPTVFAHRSASAYAPENTLAAVRRARPSTSPGSRTMSNAPATVP